MTVKVEDRPIASVRDQVVDVLIHNYSHGVISEEAFERRLDVAMGSRDPSQIMQQISDLETPDDSEIKEQKKRHFDVSYDPYAHADSEHIVNIFGGSDRTGQWVVPSQLKTLSVFGGSKIDMTDAIFTSKEVRIKSFCLFGGETLYVPPGARVMSSVICIFGGMDNKASTLSGTQGPIIRIEGMAIFGGISVKVKTNFKKMFINFAHQMKTMMNTKSGI
ncbi:DUF1707 domain-containing protein [Alteromonas sediminis]|uniref:DUF1707 domain-containing protein n=1 Tax=Alteromonas sediminis TaxID=2259342 RepID=A0A3N5YK96_9ALTE|nr:DUF1707 domain-containing protein [Alteromonas sediminis]RPJ65271.1 DUF1707 domain-containing protein [Alteromonas sediminis]